MKDYTNNNPEFSDSIQILEITDTNHADNFNAATKQLLDNDLALLRYVGDKETLDSVKADTKLITDYLLPYAKPVFGFIVHEASDLNPATRVEYIGLNRNYTPASMNMNTHAMNYGDWADWEWLKSNVPVMCNWDGGIDYYLDPNDYTKKKDGTPSDVSNVDYAGDAMAVIKKIYKKEYKIGQDRYVYFCERQIDKDFKAVGFNVGGKERDYMLIPMFYGSVDDAGKMRSIAGQWSMFTVTGNSSENTKGVSMDTANQYAALQAASPNALFFGGAIVNTLADICILLSKSTDSQGAFGKGLSSAYVNDAAQHYGSQINTVVGGGQFYGSSDGRSFNKIFHSCVLGSYMLWQRDPYHVLVNGKQKVSVDYSYDPTGESYLDTNIKLSANNYYATTQVIEDFGAVPTEEVVCTSATGYCDHTWAKAGITAVLLRFGDVNNGANGGLWARYLPAVASHAWWYYGASKLLPAPAAA